MTTDAARQIVDDFLEHEEDVQFAAVSAHLNLLALWEVATALDTIYKGARWPISHRVTLRIRGRLDPEPFLAMSTARQLERIKALDPADVDGLYRSYMDWAEDGDEEAHQLLDATVLAAILAKIDEENHSQYGEEAEIQDALQPCALYRLRQESNLGTVLTLLNAADEHRARFIAQADVYALDELQTHLERYSQQQGRSELWHRTYAEVCRRLKAFPKEIPA